MKKIYNKMLNEKHVYWQSVTRENYTINLYKMLMNNEQTNVGAKKR